VLAVGLALSALLAALIWLLAVALGHVRTLRLQRAELREASDFKTDLVAMLSHDLRQPLASVLGYAQLLTGDVDLVAGGDPQRFAAKILRGARRLQQLLEDILMMTRLDVGKLQPDPVPVPVDQSVADTVACLQDELPAVSHREVGRVWTLVDPGHLQQILTNLVGNAAKYGGPPVKVTATQAEGVVEIRVADHGPGVPPEFVPRLFGRFARAPSSGGTGTGLGLFIVRQLVEANGGHVSYQPNRPTGACFVVRLPQATPPLALAPAALEERPQVAG
jgi:signal transduction histidine kinase